MSRSPREKAALEEAMAAFAGDGIILVILREPKGGVIEPVSIHTTAPPGSPAGGALVALAEHIGDIVIEAWSKAGLKAEKRYR